MGARDARRCDVITPENIWALILAGASALVLLSNAAEKIVKAIKAAKAPISERDDRIAALEEWKEDVDRKLNRDNDRLANIDESMRVTQRALIALLAHGIDGNNTKQMEDAQTELQNHLINR